MRHPYVLPRPGWRTLAARVVLAAAIIAGLLGMHVMMSPAAHGAHGAASVGMAESRMPSHDAAAPSPAHPQPAPCGSSECADILPASDAGVWAVVCVLALLLSALLAARPAMFWRTVRRHAAPTAAGRGAAADRAPRHPPSLIVLSISRT